MRLPLYVARLRSILDVCVDYRCVLFFVVLFVCVCMIDLRVIVYAFADVCFKVAFDMTRASIGCVLCVRVFCLSVLVCSFSVGLCVVCNCMLHDCVSHYTCVYIACAFCVL